MSRVFAETITRNQITLGPNSENQSWNMFFQGTGAAFDLVVQETSSGSPTGPLYSIINSGTPGPTGAQGPTGPQGPTGVQGPTGSSNLSGSFAANSVIFYNSGITGSSNLTFSSNNLTITGNTQVSGTGSNLVRRAYGVVGYDTKRTLDDISAEIVGATGPNSQLQITITGGWSASFLTQIINSSPATQYTSFTGTGSSGSFLLPGVFSSQGNGCMTILGDQSGNNNSYEITVIRLTSSPAIWSITIRRLV